GNPPAFYIDTICPGAPTPTPTTTLTNTPSPTFTPTTLPGAGINWYQSSGCAGAPFSPRYAQGGVVFDDGTGSKMWVMGGTNSSTSFNDVWDSADGANWNQVTASAGFGLRSHFGSFV